MGLNRFAPRTTEAKEKNETFKTTLQALRSNAEIATMTPESNGLPIVGVFASVYPDIPSPELVRVQYKNCFEIKDALKSDGFRYDGTYKTWFKVVSLDQAMDALKYTHSAIIE